MEKLIPSKKRERGKRHKSFDPSRQELISAVEEFLRNGGRIRQMTPAEGEQSGKWISAEDLFDVDDFFHE